jgi:hypothetical protein
MSRLHARRSSPARSRRGIGRLSGLWLIVTLGALGLLLARAPLAPQPRAAAADRWEQLLVLEALRYLNLSQEQLQRVAALAERCDARVSRARQAGAAEYESLERILTPECEALAAGRIPTDARQAEALERRSALQQRRWQLRDEVTAEAAAGLAVILTREQAARAYRLAAGEAAWAEVCSDALLDPASRFVLPDSARQAFQDGVLEQVRARDPGDYAGEELPGLGVIYLHGPGVPPAVSEPEWISTSAEGGVLMHFYSHAGSVCYYRPNSHILISYGGWIPLGEWLATRSNPAERTVALKPLARRLFFSWEWRSALAARLAGRLSR